MKYLTTLEYFVTQQCEKFNLTEVEDNTKRHYKKFCYFQRLEPLKQVLKTDEKSIFDSSSDC